METRRSFLSRIAMWTSLAVSYGAAAAFTGRFLFPSKPTKRTRSIYVGRFSELKEGESKLVTDLRGVPVQVVRQGSALRALSTVCPHLGCRVRWEAEKQRFFCPCHNGVFNREGEVVSGPPPRGLDRYEVEVVAGNVYLRMPEPSAA